DAEIKARPRSTRAELFQFIERELNEARVVLPATRPAAELGRVTRGACDAVLANMYLNAQGFTGTVADAGLQPGPARREEAAAAADRVLNAGVYSLETNWRKNFTADNDASPETIFSLRLTTTGGLGNYLLYLSLHYNQLSPTPANGFSALGETYYAFDPDDE